MKRVSCDAEGDGIVPTQLWCIVCEDLDSSEVVKFYGPDMKEKFLEYAATVDMWVGHNFLSYDRRAFKRLLGLDIPWQKIEDTLILSHLLYTGLIPRHSLEYWGGVLGHKKPEHEDWSKFSEEMLHRCTVDANITKKLWWRFQPELKKFSRKSIELEHEVQDILEEQKDNGFALDFNKATSLHEEVVKRRDAIEASIHVDFPPVEVLVEVYEPKLTKEGELSLTAQKKLKKFEGHTKNVGPNKWELYTTQEFNLASPKQIVERLDAAGWAPTVMTEAGNPKICEENLATIPKTAPEAIHKLSEWIMLNNRAKVLEGWFEAYNPLTGCIHGTTIGIGAITHRMSHREPQMANIPAVRNDYGEEFRSCFGVTGFDGYSLLGVDISGIQLCILAHYMNDAAYTEAIARGVKENETDVHSVNKKVLQEIAPNITRDHAKTFIYAMLLGGGAVRLGNILGFTGSSAGKKGAAAKELLFKRIPAFKRVKEMCKIAAKRGYMVGIDGRRTPVKSEHFALSVYLQCGEAIVMKQMLVYTRARARHLDWAQCAVVHDETQSRVRTEQAEELGKLQVQAITDAGKLFNLRCPLTGEYRVGKNWADTH